MPPLISARNDVVGIEVVADPKGVVLCLVGSGEEKISWTSVHSCFLCSRVFAALAAHSASLWVSDKWPLGPCRFCIFVGSMSQEK